MVVKAWTDCVSGWVTNVASESPDEKLKRLESEQRRIADEIAEVRRAKEKREDTRTPGQVIADQVISHGNNTITFATWNFTSPHQWSSALVAKDIKRDLADRIDRLVNKALDAAEAEQRESDAKIVDSYILFNTAGGPSEAARRIRNNK